MGTRKIVPLRPRQKKDSPGTPKPLTLADLTVSHVFRNDKVVTLKRCGDCRHS
jgi:hypothetical protein